MKKIKIAIVIFVLFLFVLTGCKKQSIDDMKVYYNVDLIDLKYKDKSVKSLYIGQKAENISGKVYLNLVVEYNGNTVTEKLFETSRLEANEDYFTENTKLSFFFNAEIIKEEALKKFASIFESFDLKVKKYQKNDHYKEIIDFLSNVNNIPSVIPDGMVRYEPITEKLELVIKNRQGPDFEVYPYNDISYHSILGEIRNQFKTSFEKYGYDIWALSITKENIVGIEDKYLTEYGITWYQKTLEFDIVISGLTIDVTIEPLLKMNLGLYTDFSDYKIDFENNVVEYTIRSGSVNLPVVDTTPEFKYENGELTYVVDLSETDYFFADEFEEYSNNHYSERRINFNSATFTMDIPDFEVAEYQNAIDNTRFTLTYHAKDGDITTTALGSSEHPIIKLFVEYFFNDSFKMQYTYSGVQTYDEYVGFLRSSVIDTFEVSESLVKLEMVNTNDYEKEYYQDDDFVIGSSTLFNLYYVTTVPNYENQFYYSRTLSLNDVEITGFDSSEVGQKEVLVTYDDLELKLPYTIKEDLVQSISIKSGSFSQDCILYEDIDLVDSYIKVVYQSGREKDVAITSNMLSNLPTAAGNHALTITYNGKTTTQEINVLEVETITLYDGLNKTYILNEKPTCVEVKVEFTNGEYDYYVIPTEAYDTFDTTKEGTNKWNWTLGNVEFSHSYEVLGDVYLIYYLNSDSKYVISGYTSVKPEENYLKLDDPRDVIIPSTINGVEVVGIDALVFDGITSIRSVLVSEGIQNIGNYAFRNCIALTNVILPTNVTLGTTILKGATALLDLTIGGTVALYDIIGNTNLPDLKVTVTSEILIDDFLTNDVSNIKELVFDSTVVNLGNQNYLTKVTTFSSNSINVIVENNVIYVENKKVLYYYPTNKTNVSFVTPDETETIKYFPTNNNLSEITLSAGIISIPENFLSNSENLTTVIFLGSVSTLPSGAFSNCNKLTNFTFPQGLNEIGDYVLSYSDVKTIIIPNGVSVISPYAFYASNCEKLYIPSSASNAIIDKTGYDQFRLPKLTSLAFDGSVQYTKTYFYDSFTKSTIQNIYITGESTTLHEDMLYQFNPATSPFNLYIPKNITSIASQYVTGQGMICSVNLYYEGSSLSINSSAYKNLYKNVNYDKWWIQ